MKTLVSRLREDADSWIPKNSGNSALVREAADEIEHLRVEVAQLRTANAIWEQTQMSPQSKATPGLIVSAEEAKAPFAFCHWSKDFLVPYTDCHCDTCVAARSAPKAGEKP